jgi:hypothetical protein
MAKVKNTSLMVFLFENCGHNRFLNAVKLGIANWQLQGRKWMKATRLVALDALPTGLDALQ